MLDITHIWSIMPLNISNVCTYEDSVLEQTEELEGESAVPNMPWKRILTNRLTDRAGRGTALETKIIEEFCERTVLLVRFSLTVYYYKEMCGLRV